MRKFESKKRYSKISYIKRTKLIELVENDGIGVTKAAKQLRIKTPTAKVILRNYRNKGRIYIKKSDKSLPEPEAQRQTPEVKEEHIEEQKIQVPDEVLQYTPLQFYPQINWLFMQPFGGMMMF